MRKRALKSSSIVIHGPLVILESMCFISRQQILSVCVGRLSQQQHVHHCSELMFCRSATWGRGLNSVSGSAGGCSCPSGNVGSNEYGSKSMLYSKINKINIIVRNSNKIWGKIYGSFATVTNAGGVWILPLCVAIHHFRIHTPPGRVNNGGDQRAVLKK